MAAGRTDLSEVSVDELLAEVQRRLVCQTKPEKRVILIGAVAAPLFFYEKSMYPLSNLCSTERCANEDSVEVSRNVFETL